MQRSRVPRRTNKTGYDNRTTLIKLRTKVVEKIIERKDKSTVDLKDRRDRNRFTIGLRLVNGQVPISVPLLSSLSVERSTVLGP